MIRFTCLTVALVLLGSLAEAQPALPASGESAGEALLKSPRHGEWIDVPLPGSDKPIRTWVVYPETSGKAAVVLVIHEIFGLTDWIRAVADQLAAEGFIAVAPDLLSGKGPNGGGTESFEGDKVREAIRGLGAGEVAERLNAVRAHAIALPAANGRSASIGFCWGGTASFRYAAQQPALDAAVVFYGSAPTELSELDRIACPVLGLYGGDDARVTSTVEPTARQMQDLQKQFEHHTYDRAGHGFLRQQDGKDGANRSASEKAWQRTIEFLRASMN